MRILLLETDKFLARSAVKMFEFKGFEVDWQVDPQAAVVSLDNSPVDLIITDLILAGHSGIEFLYELRSYCDWQETPVMIFSSVPVAELGACAGSLQHLRIETYHHKPSTTLADLVRSVQNCLQPALA